MTRSADVFHVVPRRSLPPVALVWALAAGAGALAGPAQLLGVLAGGALATTFLASTFWLLRILRHVEPGASLAVALSVYLLKITVLATLVLLLQAVEAVSGPAAAAAAGLCTVAWVVAEVAAFTRLRVPAFDAPVVGGRGGGC